MRRALTRNTKASSLGTVTHTHADIQVRYSYSVTASVKSNKSYCAVHVYLTAIRANRRVQSGLSMHARVRNTRSGTGGVFYYA